MSYSEKKIDRLEDRLVSIENLLLDLASKLHGNNAQAAPKEQMSKIQLPLNRRSERSPFTDTDKLESAPFEGETGINTQSDYVRDLLIQVVGETPSVSQSSDIREALTALEDINLPTTDRSLNRRNRCYKVSAASLGCGKSCHGQSHELLGPFQNNQSHC
jgi:hypothetical protein